MKCSKLFLALIASFVFSAGVALADHHAKAKCCEKAAKDGKECTHECCVAAAKDHKTCEKCSTPSEKK